eukprot:TRINITY_DN56372_c0_g1_i1.p1 TRINITY_DN56372_c0_g1~~TRINITY_DN56372_c0_g1_i1.p1  ORF type:complete len:197 (+),score=35.45 TRINITY_DN56372_c0_g1_i1:62-652(+)
MYIDVVVRRWRLGASWHMALTKPSCLKALLLVASTIHLCYGCFEMWHRYDKAATPDDQPGFQHYETMANLVAGLFGFLGAQGVPEGLGGMLACQIVASLDYAWAIVTIANCDRNDPRGPCVPYNTQRDVHVAFFEYALGLVALAAGMGVSLANMQLVRRAGREVEATAKLAEHRQDDKGASLDMAPAVVGDVSQTL